MGCYIINCIIKAACPLLLLNTACPSNCLECTWITVSSSTKCNINSCSVGYTRNAADQLCYGNYFLSKYR